MTKVVVLVSGSGTLLQALIDAASEPSYAVTVVAVGSDRPDIEGLRRAERAGIPTFVCSLADHPDRAGWDAALDAELAAYAPDLVVSAGFMKILGPTVLGRHRVINSHPALLPSFPGAHAVRDALAHGVKVTGTTCHWVDAGMDTGPIIDQVALRVHDDDTEDSLHERIKVLERELLVRVVGSLGGQGDPRPQDQGLASSGETVDDVERLKRHYAGRASEVGDRYHPSKPDVAFGSAELDVAIMRALRRNGLTDFDRLRVLEVGSGGGANLLRFLRWGFRPENLTGCELVADCHEASRKALPEGVRLVHGDARHLDELGSFDIVLQSTVLSSILDDEVQRGVAETMWRAVRPGGIVMSFDFTVDNPANKHVRGVTRTRLEQLFPGEVVAQRVLLAPPIARRLGWHPAVHAALRAMPLLRTHLLATIRRT